MKPSLISRLWLLVTILIPVMTPMLVISASHSLKRFRETGSFMNTDFQDCRKMLLPLESQPPDRLTIWRGGPHPMWEDDVQPSGPMKSIHGEGYYRANHQPPAHAVRTIRHKLLYSTEWRKWLGMKLCGGFHADFGLEFHFDDGSAPLFIALCYGCHEAKLYRGGQSLYVDFDASEKTGLKELLYRATEGEPAK